MNKWTGIEIQCARQDLEQASATILGRMIFEFSSLDMALGLMLAWAHEGTQLEKLTTMVSSYTFHKKPNFLAELAQKKYQANKEAMDAYNLWLAKVHELRNCRNDLVHGRWGVEHMKNQLINVV